MRQSGRRAACCISPRSPPALDEGLDADTRRALHQDLHRAWSAAEFARTSAPAPRIAVPRFLRRHAGKRPPPRPRGHAARSALEDGDVRWVRRLIESCLRQRSDPRDLGGDARRARHRRIHRRQHPRVLGSFGPAARARAKSPPRTRPSNRWRATRCSRKSSATPNTPKRFSNAAWPCCRRAMTAAPAWSTARWPGSPSSAAKPTRRATWPRTASCAFRRAPPIPATRCC